MLYKDEFPTVIVTAGGEGTRLYPLTLQHPKPLTPLVNYPIILRILEILVLEGCRKFVIAAKGIENATRIKNAIRYGEILSKKLGVPDIKIMYQPNYSDLGSGDSVKYCMEYYDIRSPVLVMNSDNIVEIDLKNFLEYHRNRNAMLTVLLKELDEGSDISQFGVVEAGNDGRITRFVEKPKKEEAPSRMINAGVYLFSPEIRNVFNEMGGEVKDIGRDVIPSLIRRGQKVYGFLCRGYWTDIGAPGSLLHTTRDMLYQKIRNIRFDDKQRYRDNIWIHSTTLRAISEKLEQKKINISNFTFIGGDCRIGENVSIENSCIGDNCIIEDNATIRNSIVMDFSNVKKGCYLNSCIIGRFSTIEEGSRIDADMEVSVVGNDRSPVIGEGVRIFKNSVIGPKKRVAPIREAHRILSAERFVELGYDSENVYFIEK